jgi:hypothetical protein
MADQPVAVLDANVLLNLATPVVDGRTRAPTGADPLLAVLTTYDVHVPDAVLGEVSAATGSGDLLSAAADAVLKAAPHLRTHDVDGRVQEPLEYGLDAGETHAIWLSNHLGADLFVTDEFNTTNYLFVTLALDDHNVLYTTPHVLCVLGARDVLDPAYVDAALTYYLETKGWNRQYVEQLRRQYLDS